MSERKPRSQLRNKPRPGREAEGAAKRVLVVEDSPTQAEALGAALTSAGYAVTLAASGDDALGHLAAGAFDLVVSDIVMPGSVDGYELSRRIKAGPQHEVPVVLFTSLADPLDIIHGLECGADNFFTKSHGTEHLLQRIKVLLETKQARTRGRVQLGVRVLFLGREFTITSDREQIIDLLMSTFEDAVFQNRELVNRETQLARTHQTLQGLYNLAVGLNQVTSEAAVVEMALDGALGLPSVQAGWISLREGESGFRLAAARNLPPALQKPGAMEGECLCRRRLLSGELKETINVLECDRLQRAQGDTGGLRYHASIPLWVRDQTVGILNLVGADQGVFSEDDLRILHGVGNEIAIALERAQLHQNLEKLVDERTAALTKEIAEHERADAALRQSDERFRQLADNIHEVFFITDVRSGRVLYVSPAYEQVWGRSCESAYAAPDAWTEVVHPEDRERMRAAPATSTGKPWSEEVFRIVRPDGQVRWVRSRTSPVREPSGEVHRIVGVAEDVTDLRAIEQQLQQAQKMEAVGTLAGGVAHDFNNLLTAITGYTDLVLEDLPPGDPRREDLQEVRKAADRAAALTRQLLAFSRRQVLQPRVLDINEVVTGTEKLLRRIIGEDVVLETRLGADLPGVHADAGQLEQVIVNLAVNARDAMPNGGRLTIETGVAELDATYAASRPEVHPGRYVLLALTDTGHGMSPETQSHIFEPFFTTKGPGKGTGLGLATVYGIVKQSEGHVAAYSEVGRGTTMKVYLPGRDVRVERAAPAAAEAAPPSGTETILLVEDEEGVLKLAQEVLARNGYAVLVARDGAEAVARCHTHAGEIHLMVTDVVMPGMGGPESASTVKCLRPGMKVLFMSGYADRAIAEHRVLDPGMPYLQKPFTPAALARKVRDVLDAPVEPA